MSAPAQPTHARRRTQAERRAATRNALLEATVDCLVEYGYANVTTKRIADRAGVTRGAQPHYFSTKAELVIAAVRHLADKLLEDYLQNAPVQGRSPQRVLAETLDALWQVHNGPMFAASMELWVASRTDEELREQFADFEADIYRTIARSSLKVLPTIGSDPRSAALLNTTLAAVRGLALLRFVDHSRDLDKTWKATKQHLLDLWKSELD